MPAILNLINDVIEVGSLGKGLKSPLEVDPNTNDFATVEGEDNIRQCITDLISVRVGERIMREDDGSDVPALTFENMQGVIDLLPTRLTSLLNRVMGARIKDVRVSARKVDDKQVQAEISFVSRTTGKRGNLIYPFFTEQ